MLRIGKSYLERTDSSTRLCADISANGRGITLWFSVDSGQEDWLALGRADPFVMALLPGAMRGGHEIVCEDPMSERLHYQLVNGLIPTLAFAGELYHPIQITAPLTAEGLPNQGAVGTGFSGGADCLYTIMRHGRDSEFPLTHIAVFNNGHVMEGEAFQTLCRNARRFAAEQGLGIASVDTNIAEVFSAERFVDVYSFRNYACALALEGLFSVYFLSSGHDAANFQMNLRNTANYDLLTARHVSTESVAFYHSGEEVKRWEKLKALSNWEPSWHWFHPCFQREIDRLNCGRCKKCVRDIATFYALDCLDRYKAVYDIDDYFRNLSERMGYLLLHSHKHLYAETIQLLKDRNISIPPKSFVYARQFRIAMEHLKANEGEGEPPC